jgi:GT2 family glycosyltransferase
MSMIMSVLIVNYNGAGFLAECIDSVLESKTEFLFEVIVIDNASTDSSSHVLQTYEDRVTVILSPDNLGFSQGNNVAAKKASGQYLFLLNNDTIIPNTLLQGLYDFGEAHPDMGAVSPKLLYEDGRLQMPGSVLGQWRFKSKVTMKVPFIAGAAVLMQKSLYDDMGGLDGNLFFYNDDIDLCMCLRKRRRPIYYVPSLSLIHFGGLSTKFRKIGSLMEGYRGGLYIAYKHYPKIVYHSYRFLLLFDVIPRLIFHTLSSLFSDKHSTFRDLYLKVLIFNWRQDIFGLKRD